MSWLDYARLRGRRGVLPNNTNVAPGYMVSLVAANGKPNSDICQRTTWTAKAQFELDYQATVGMSFGMALETMKLGHQIAREGWVDTWLTMVLGAHDIQRLDPTFSSASVRAVLNVEVAAIPWVAVKTSDNKFVPWQAYHTDMLAEDWHCV